MKKLFKVVKKFVGLGVFLISLLLISSYVYSVHPSGNISFNNNLMKDINLYINEAYAYVPPGGGGGSGGNFYTVSTTKVNGIHGTISPGNISGIAPFNIVTFSVVPNIGYSASATGCGGSLSGTTYTTEAIVSDCTVTATYTQSPPIVNSFYPTNVINNKVDIGGIPTINWDVSNFSSCTLTGGGLNYSFSISQSSGSVPSPAISNLTTYTLNCITSGPTPPTYGCHGTVNGSVGPNEGSGPYEGQSCTQFQTYNQCLQGWLTHGCRWTSP